MTEGLLLDSALMVKGEVLGPTISMALVKESPVLERISATISLLVLPSLVITYFAPSCVTKWLVFDEVTAMTLKPLKVANWMANCPVTVDPPHIRRCLGSSAFESVGDMGGIGPPFGIGTSSQSQSVMAAVSAGTPRQAAVSKVRFDGIGTTACAGLITRTWKQPASRFL